MTGKEGDKDPNIEA